MDNRVFNVNGKTNDALLAALELAFSQAGSKCKGWKATEKGLILMWYVDGTTTPLPTKEGMTASEILPMVLSWMKSDAAKEVEMTGWDANADHDGHNTVGWRVYCEDWGHVGGNSAVICAVKPAFMWHGK